MGTSTVTTAVWYVVACSQSLADSERELIRERTL